MSVPGAAGAAAVAAAGSTGGLSGILGGAAAAIESAFIRYTAESWPLKKGAKGENVRKLQIALGVSADGSFGPLTEAALMRKHGVTSVSLTLFNTIVGAAPVTGGSTTTTTGSTAAPTIPEKKKDYTIFFVIGGALLAYYLFFIKKIKLF